MLAYVFDARCLREKFVHLITHVELLAGLEVPTRELLFHPSQHLHGSCILSLARFRWDTLLDIKDATVKNRWTTMSGEIAGLHTIFKVDDRCD